jgi:uncharacterized protein YdaT
MPWDESYYPRSMRKLPSEVRLKAIEIANALLEEGYDEGKAIRIAIAKAKEWARDASRVETVGLAVRREAACLRVSHPRVAQR